MNTHKVYRKATDNELLSDYMKLKSIWAVANKRGMCGQSVHERLARLGVQMEGRGKKWTEEDTAFLQTNYLKYRNSHKLDKLAAKMGRTKPYICRKAKALGLTDKSKSYTAGRRSITKDGYVCIGHVGLEHIAVAEKRLGRRLLPGEVVHHLDEDKTNNDPSNLIVMSRSDHMSYHGSKPRKPTV